MSDRFDAHSPRNSPPPKHNTKPHHHQSTLLKTLMLLTLTYITYMLATFALITSKLIPGKLPAVLDAMRRDWYYCSLAVLTPPIAYFFVIANWIGMKMFKHN